jgi:hypothetical protein
LLPFLLSLVHSVRTHAAYLSAQSVDERFLVCMQDVGGDEDWHLYVQAVDSSSPSKDLTPFKVGLAAAQKLNTSAVLQCSVPHAELCSRTHAGTAYSGVQAAG